MIRLIRMIVAEHEGCLPIYKRMYPHESRKERWMNTVYTAVDC